MEVEIDIDTLIYSCTRSEKRDLYRALLDDADALEEKEFIEMERKQRLEEEFLLMRELEAMTPFELKKTLCNLLDVGSYTDEKALREKLEEVITAR